MTTFARVFAATALLSLCCAVPAGADATACGSSPATACSVNTGAQGETFTGSISQGATDVWYVFCGGVGTRVNTTLTDEEDPSCSGAGFTVDCGRLTDDLFGSRYTIGGAPGVSTPTAGMTVPISWSTPLPAAGIYYLRVSGSTTDSETGVQETTPYQFVVSASRTVQWPAPPMCTVPALRGLTLSRAESELRAAHCTVGQVHRIYSAALKTGLQLSVSASRGSTHPADFPVAISLSRGPKPQRR